ncbi:ATP-binding cassette domain-containing protein [Mycoplasmatota bacterium]|nr:ATP-binding cassette domain-containing protein [Mycoplasmatota bacterium]
MIEINNLKKIYGSQNNTKVIAINDLNLNFDSRGLVFIVGRSGSGKSTLLNLLGGLDNYDNGEIRIKGISTKDFTQSELDLYRNRNIGFIFQEYNLLNELNVYQNIALAFDIKGIKVDYSLIDSILEQVGLVNFGKRMPNELSTGQKQRVAIARALIKSPDIILADEPTGALDSVTGTNLINLLKELSKEKLVIVVSHDRSLADEYGDRIIELSDGRLIGDFNKQKYDKENTKINLYSSTKDLKKYKVSYKFSLLMAVLNFKRKKLRFTFAIMLSTFAFILFGVIDTTRYSKADTTLKSFYDSGIDYVSLKKTYSRTENDEFYTMSSKISNRDINVLAEKFPNYQFIPAFDQYNDEYQQTYCYEQPRGGEKVYFNGEITGTVEMNNSFIEDYNLKLLAGKFPEKNSEDNEILITEYTFQHFKKFGYKNSGNKIEITNYQDMLGKQMILRDKQFVITGVINTHFNFDRYNVLLKKNLVLDDYIDLINEMNEYVTTGRHSVIFVRDGYYNDNLNPIYTGLTDNALTMIFNKDESGKDVGAKFFSVSKLDNLDQVTLWEDEIEKTELADNEVLIPISSIPTTQIIVNMQTFSELIYQTSNILINEFTELHFKEIQMEFENEYGSGSPIDYANFIRRGYGNPFHEGFDKDYFKSEAVKKVLNEIFFDLLKSVELFNFENNYGQYNFEENVKVVGFYGTTDNSSSFNLPIIVSDKLFNDFIEASEGDFNFVFTKLTHNPNEDIELVKYNNETGVGVRYHIVNEVTYVIKQVSSWLEIFSRISFYLGIGLALFSIVLFFNFISTSISNRKKEIGIIRALGSTGKDIFRIFICESVIIAMVIFVLSLVGTYSISVYSNYFLRNKYCLILTLSSFKLRQVILLIALSISVAIVSTYIPIKRFSKQKPIDVINNM